MESPRQPLTPVERALWRFLLDHTATHTFQPSIREIADRTGMTQLSVRVNLNRGRKRLKEILGDGDE